MSCGHPCTSRNNGGGAAAHLTRGAGFGRAQLPVSYMHAHAMSDGWRRRVDCGGGHDEVVVAPGAGAGADVGSAAGCRDVVHTRLEVVGMEGCGARQRCLSPAG